MRIEEMGSRLCRRDQNELRRALGEKVILLAQAMHDIEWNDSGDGANEESSIKRFLGDTSSELSILVDDAKALLVKLSEAIPPSK